MGIFTNLWRKAPHHERDIAGNNWYSFGYDHTTLQVKDYSCLELGLNHPILLGVALTRAEYLNKGIFYIQKGDEKIYDTSKDKLLYLINNPNGFQSKEDFLNELVTQLTITGNNAIIPKTLSGREAKANERSRNLELTDELVNLSEHLIVHDWKQINKTNLDDKKSLDRLPFLYYRKADKQGKYDEILYSQTIRFYDLYNGSVYGFPYLSKSRVSSLNLALSNSILGMESKNTIIQNNGKFVGSAGTTKGSMIDAMPLEKKEKESFERQMNRNTGMSLGRKMFSLLSRPLDVKSLHLNAQELQLEEYYSGDLLKCLDAWNIPPEIFPISKEGSTYENQEYAEVKYIQGATQKLGDDICGTLNQNFSRTEQTGLLKIDFSHLPIMQVLEREKQEKHELKANTIKTTIEAIELGLNTGILDKKEANELLKKMLHE